MHRTFHHSHKRHESGSARTRLLICDKESGSAAMQIEKNGFCPAR